MPLDSQMLLLGPGGGRAQPPVTLGRSLSLPGATATDLIVVGAVSGLLHRCVLLVVAHLHAYHRVHVQAHQLPSLDHRDADLQAGEREAEGKVCELWSWFSQSTVSLQFNGWSSKKTGSV